MSARPTRKRLRSAAVLAGLMAVILLTTGTAGMAPAAGLPADEASPAPGAAAWVVEVVLDGTPVLELGRTAVDPGAATATATPLLVNGQGLPVAAADAANPVARSMALDWTDQTGSLTVKGGYAEAVTGGQRWSAHAGLGAATGTGIALASIALSWDQQTQLLGALQSFNDRVAPVVNATFAGLAPVLALVGLPTPHFVPVAPAGLVDAGAGRLSGSTAEAAVATGYATAHADVSTGEVKLLGGFVTVGSLSSDATVERGTDDKVSARSTLTDVTIAGIPVTVDANGIRAAGGGPMAGLLDPVLHTLLAQLAAAGIAIDAGVARPVGCCATSTAGLAITIAGPGPALSFSLAHAEASAPEPGPRPAASPDEATPAVVSGAVTSATTPPTTAPRPTAIAPTPIAATASVPRAASPRTGRLADLGDDVVRALRVAYLTLVGAGAAGVAYLVVAGPSRPARHRRKPS